MYFRARYYDPDSGEFISRDPLEYVDGMSQYRGYMGLLGTDPNGMTVIIPGDGLHWHHMLPFEFDKWFKSKGINIDLARFGWWLDCKTHSELHSQGWNKDWQDWMNSFPDKRKITKADIIRQLNKMKRMKKYRELLDKGKSASVNYKYGYIRRCRRDGVKIGKLFNGKGKGKILGSMLGLACLGPVCKGADFACGGCDQELTDLKNAVRNFEQKNNQSNCLQLYGKLQAFIECTGVENDFAQLAINNEMLKNCSPLGN
jgi:hypothetical protein